jgi:hypothetical protein
MTLPLEQQVATLIKVLTNLQPSAATPEHLKEVLGYIKDIPPQMLPPEFPDILGKAFGLKGPEAENLYNVRKRAGTHTDSFDKLVPSEGWLRTYVDYSAETEPPTVFHFFAGLVQLGATMARNVYFDKGSGPIFPNLCVIIVAPAGICRKTTACNIGVDLFRAIGGNVLADRSTPEAIVEAFRDRTSATGLIYAPELAVFLGKQKYMEGLVPMLTALFDCPREWSSATVLRGEAKLFAVALSMLGCTTMDWLQSAIPKDAFGGGFMSRILFVVQHTTPKSIPVPPPLDSATRAKLVKGLLDVQKHMQGVCTFSPEARLWWDDWYKKRRLASSDKQFAGYYQRKPDHLLRIAMCLNAAAGAKSLVVTEATLSKSERILAWIERYLPAAFEELSSNPIGDEHTRMIRQLRTAGGQLTHSEWLRKNTSRMNADQFRRAVETMRQGRLITFDAKTKSYFLLPEGWDENG